MPLGSLSAVRPSSKSLSVDFKRKEASKIVIENSSLVSRIIKKTAFLPISKMNRDFQEHEQFLQMIRKMDAKSNKMKVKGLEKLSLEKLQQLPHIHEVERWSVRGSPVKNGRSKSYDIKENKGDFYEKRKRNLKENSKRNLRISKENMKENEEIMKEFQGKPKEITKENIRKKEENPTKIRFFTNEFL